MKLLPSLVMFASAVSACSDPAYRCKNPEGTKSGDYSRTTEICAEISNGASMCYCYAAAEYREKPPRAENGSEYDIFEEFSNARKGRKTI